MNSGLSPILLALYARDSAALEEALQSSGPFDLFEAAALGDDQQVSALLAQGTAVGQRAVDGFTALHLAAYFGRVDVARALLAAGAKPNVVAAHPSQVQPLHSAVAGRNYEVTELLLNYGSDVNATQRGGWTALHAVVKHRNEPLVRLLMDHGADPTQRADDGQSSTDLADGWDNAEIRRTLFGRADTMDLDFQTGEPPT